MLPETISNGTSMADYLKTLEMINMGYSLPTQLAEFDRDIERMSGYKSVPTGIPLFDNRVDMMPEDLITIAARPGGGKTATMVTMFVSQMVSECATPGFISLEMSRTAILMRMMSVMSGVPFKSLRIALFNSGEGLSERQKDALSLCRRRMMESIDLTLCDQTGMSIGAIYNLAKSWKVQNGMNILFIDQLSKVISHDTRNIRERFTQNTNDLKMMARELKIPVMIAAQLRRPDDYKVRSPRIRDLKESGSIEEDSDIVMMPWRPDIEGETEVPQVKFKGEVVPTKGNCFWFCRKYRNGETWAEKTKFHGPTMSMAVARE